MGMPPLRTNIIKIDPTLHHLQVCLTAKVDDTPIGLYGIHAGRDMKIMQANQRSSNINNTVGSA